MVRISATVEDKVQDIGFELKLGEVESRRTRGGAGGHARLLMFEDCGLEGFFWYSGYPVFRSGGSLALFASQFVVGSIIDGVDLPVFDN